MLGQWEGFGMRGNASRPIWFDGVHVGASQCSATPALKSGTCFRWWPHIFLRRWRNLLGIAEAAFDIAVVHVKTRSYDSLGESLSDAPVIRHQTDEMWARLSRQDNWCIGRRGWVTRRSRRPCANSDEQGRSW